MIADVFKMGTLKGFILCAIIITAKMMIAESSVYTSAESAVNFSQCMIEKTSESPFFNQDDRNSMIAVQDVMSKALHAKEHTLISSKILITAFITSFADIILNSDVSKISYRKETYFSALQQCSLSSTGYVDAEFIAEAQGILSVLERNKPQNVKYEETGAFSGVGIPVAGTFNSAPLSQTSNAGSSVAVQPSPVQNPQAPQYFYPNDRTVFEEQRNPNIPPIASSAQDAFNSQHAVQSSSQIGIASSFGTGIPAQQENIHQTFSLPSITQTRDFSSSSVSSSQYQNFPVGFDESRISQPQKENLGPHLEKFPSDYDIVSQSETGGKEVTQSEIVFTGTQSGSFPYDYDAKGITETDIVRSDALSYAEFPQTNPINTGGISQTFNEGLRIPQTKESSIIVIPPKTNEQFVSDENLPQNQQQGAEERVYVSTIQETAAQPEVSDFSMTSPEDIFQEQQQFSSVTSFPTSESTVFNMLKNSPKFKEIFNSEIAQENAINLASYAMGLTFSGYNSNIKNDALVVVTEEVLKVRVPSPETFAFAISNAICTIAKHHDSFLAVNPLQIATSFLSNLDNAGQFHSQQETVENQPKDYNTDDFSMTSPAVIPQEQQQYSDVVSYPTLESIIFNTLINSPKFRETFNFEISQENAINLARDLTERTFSGYDSNIKNSALSIVTEEVLKVRTPSPDTFAFAISNALGYVLKHHESSLTAEHSQVATNFLSNLDNTGQFQSHQGSIGKQPQDYNTDENIGQFQLQPEIVEKQPPDYDTSESAYYEFNEKQTDFDFQSPPLSPEDRKDEIFSLSLAQYLIKSEAIRNFYCDENKPDDKVQLSFSIIKASLTDYGQHVAALAASVASGALSELSKEGLCSNYAKTISESVAEILEENGVDNASAEDVARNMEQNLLQRQIIPTESPKPAIIFDNVPSSISKNETYATEPKLESFTPVEKDNSQHPETGKQPKSTASSDSKDAFDYEFTYPDTLLHKSSDLPTVRPNISSEKQVLDSDKHEQTFGDYLFQHFKALKSIFSEESDENNSKGNSTNETGEVLESGKDITEESSNSESSQTGNQKKETISNPESDAIAISSDQSEDDAYYNPIAVEGGDELLSYQDESEIPQKDVSYSYSPEDNFRTSGVELQPSFQSPTFNSDDAAEKLQQNPGITSHDDDHKDTSIEFARQVSEKTESIIIFIRGQNFNIGNLCAQLNQLALLVDIPELDKCEPTAAVDYLLNVLRATIKILSGV